MRKTILISLLFLLSAIVIGNANASTLQTGSISGFVTESSYIYSPIAGADVWAAGPDAEYIYHTITQTDGSYIIPSLPSNTYTVKAYKDGFAWEWYSQQTNHWDANGVVVTEPGDTSGINFTLSKAGSISGHVFKEDGSTVITDVLIRVHANGVSSGTSSLGANVSQSDGSYTITGLAPGTYKVEANYNNEPGYVVKYYDDKTDWDSADTIEVYANQTTAGIDFVLEPGGSISGNITAQASGNPIPDVQVCIRGYESGGGFGCDQTDTSGNYSYGGLPSGNYKVEVSAPGWAWQHYDNELSWNDADPVAVIHGQETSGIDLALLPGGSIDGYVYDTDGVTPLSNIHMSLDGPGFGWGDCTDSNGYYSFESIPRGYGYRVRAASPGGCGGPMNTDYIQQYYDGVYGQDDATVLVIDDSTPSYGGIDFTLELGGSISGVVYNQDGTATIGGGRVVVDGTVESIWRSTCTDSDGTYMISGLPQADYKVYAYGFCDADPNYVVELWQERFTWDTADIVTLDETSPDLSGIDFTLELGGEISGRVLLADGATPVENACVRVSTTAPELTLHPNRWTTPSDGSFTLYGMPTTGIYLRTDVNCWGDNPDLQDEWFASGGSTADASTAEMILISSGETITDGVFTLDIAASTNISPEAGGILTSTANISTTLAFPPGAVSEPITVTYIITTSQPISTGLQFVGQNFSIKAVTADGTPVTTFSEPFTITINYSDADVFGLDEASLTLNFWNNQTGQWEELLATVDPAANTITAFLDHLTDFAIIGDVLDQIYLPLISFNR
ncbi:carboxypeptidase regulatory-like domain-containing protein [Chloroflexota bacterium]